MGEKFENNFFNPKKFFGVAVVFKKNEVILQISRCLSTVPIVPDGQVRSVFVRHQIIHPLSTSPFTDPI